MSIGIDLVNKLRDKKKEFYSKIKYGYQLNVNWSKMAENNLEAFEGMSVPDVMEELIKGTVIPMNPPEEKLFYVKAIYNNGEKLND